MFLQPFQHFRVAPGPAIGKVGMDLSDRNGYGNAFIQVMTKVKFIVLRMKINNFILIFMVNFTEPYNETSFIMYRERKIIQTAVTLYLDLTGKVKGQFHEGGFFVQHNLYGNVPIRDIKITIMLKERFGYIQFKFMNSFLQSFEMNNILILKFQNNRIKKWCKSINNIMNNKDKLSD